jgi:dienelactone hydrolase
MKLQVQPLVALCDDKISICVSELPPSGKVKISASMCLPWAENVPFESFAWFTADSNGELDLSKQKPDSGTYDFIDSMGLIVSLKRKNKGGLKDIAQNISVNRSMFIDIGAECGSDIASARLERLFKANDVESQRISGKFVGELFYTENPGNKTVLLLGGSNGGIDANLPIAALLASHGFNVLTVAYFEEKGLPDKLSEIPLEYFERVFEWISENPMTNGEEIQLMGISKGGELALLLASRYPNIAKVVGFAPHAFCFQGIAFKNVSSWTYGGKSLPFIRLKTRWLVTDILSCIVRNKPFGYADTYMRGLSVATNKEAARIKVENARADVLLFAGKQDNMWNSYDGCVQIMDDLRAHDFRYTYDCFSYNDAGHPFYAPYVIPVGETQVKLAPRLALSLGGTLEANAHAQADSWEKAIEFFKG